MARTKLVNVSLDELQREIARRRKALPKLEKRRARLMKALESIEAQLGPLSAPPKARTASRKRRGRRTQNTVSLGDRLAGLLKGAKPMTVGDLMDAALAAGHKSTSKNFRLLVNQTLSRDRRFRNAGRGSYALKVERKKKAVKVAEQKA